VNISSFLNVRWIIAAVVALVVAGSVYGFAASNTVAASGAGDGAGAISGYTIGSVTYVLNSTDPANLDSVGFSVTPAGSNPQPTTVKVQLVTSGTWYSAAFVSGTAWTVDVSSASVTAASVNNLRVVAAQ